MNIMRSDHMGSIFPSCLSVSRQGRPVRGPLWACGSRTHRPLKPLGYAIGPFGKSTLGDHNAFAPAVQGFDEFRGTGTNRALRRARTS
jgi:hypothetical protein